MDFTHYSFYSIYSLADLISSIDEQRFPKLLLNSATDNTQNEEWRKIINHTDRQCMKSGFIYIWTGILYLFKNTKVRWPHFMYKKLPFSLLFAYIKKVNK